MNIRLKLWAILAILVITSLSCGKTEKQVSVSDIGQAFIAALESGDHQASWALLSPSLQQEYGTFEDWVDYITAHPLTGTKIEVTDILDSEGFLLAKTTLNGDIYSLILVFSKNDGTWLIKSIVFEAWRNP
jgi:hypothetical protein